jgi:hypothetical protein
LHRPPYDLDGLPTQHNSGPNVRRYENLVLLLVLHCSPRRQQVQHQQASGSRVWSSVVVVVVVVAVLE